MSSNINTPLSRLALDNNYNAIGGPRKCPKCNLICRNRRALHEHQREKGHYCCDECDSSFHQVQDLVSHRQNNHRAEQSLTCPGCDQHFLRAAAWVAHIEELKCPTIFPSTIEARRNERLQFSEALKNLNPANSKELYYRPQTLTTDDSTTETYLKYDGHRPHDSPDANKLYFQPDAFPRTEAQKFRAGDSKQVDLLTGDNPDPIDQKPGAWGKKKDLFPDALSAVPPPPELMENIRQPGPASSSLRPTGQRIIDPDHPDFNAAVFMNPILGTFKCPYLLCKVKPKTPNGLIMHLRSPAHSDVSMSCPCCKKVFKSMSAWVSHTESTASCGIRDSSDYRPALAQVTGGILDVDPVKTLKNNTPLFKVDKTFAEEVGRKKPASVPGSEKLEPAKDNKQAKPRPGFRD